MKTPIFLAAALVAAVSQSAAAEKLCPSGATGLVQQAQPGHEVDPDLTVLLDDGSRCSVRTTASPYRASYRVRIMIKDGHAWYYAPAQDAATAANSS